MPPEFIIDARDLLCPLPVLRLRKALSEALPGQTVLLLATDPMATVDIPHFCAEQGHHLVATRDLEHGTAYTVRCG